MHNKEEIKLFDRLISKLLITHFSNLVKSSDRDDVKQEIISKIVFKKLTVSMEKGTAEKWLYRLIKNYLIDQFRKKKTTIYLKEDFSDMVIPVDATSNLEEELFEDRWNQYNELLARENPIDQKIFRLRFEEGLCDKEVASRLGVPINLLAMRRRRVRLRMKKDYRPNRGVE
jgi:RNA polymerase sigma factor (sigma-70 family)